MTTPPDDDLGLELADLDLLADLVEPIAPPAHVRARLLASIGGGRFEPFAPRMAALFDVSVERAREILALVERPGSWEARLPGIELVHFRGGPACATADCGLVRIAAGVMFPPHVHVGEETSLVLEGRLRDGARVLVAGDELVLPPRGPTHHVGTEGDTPVIYAARVVDGIEIGGVRLK